MASTFGWGDKKLVADITRLSTGYAQESVDMYKLAAVMEKYKGLADCEDASRAGCLCHEHE